MHLVMALMYLLTSRVNECISVMQHVCLCVGWFNEVVCSYDPHRSQVMMHEDNRMISMPKNNFNEFSIGAVKRMRNPMSVTLSM